jgi:hypothetical protein
MSDFDVVSSVLAALLAMDAFIAFRWGMVILSLVLSYWLVTPPFIRKRIEDELEHERENSLRRLGSRRL